MQYPTFLGKIESRFFLDSARLYVDTPHGFVLYRPKMAVLPDTLSSV
jgi:hypothetical protein